MLNRFLVAIILSVPIASETMVAAAKPNQGQSQLPKSASSAQPQEPYGRNPNSLPPNPVDFQEPYGRNPNSWSPYPREQEPIGRNPNSWSPYPLLDQQFADQNNLVQVWIPDQVINGRLFPGHLEMRSIDGSGIAAPNDWPNWPNSTIRVWIDGAWQTVPSDQYDQISQRQYSGNIAGTIDSLDRGGMNNRLRQDEMLMRDYPKLGVRLIFQSGVPPTVNDSTPNLPGQASGLIAGDKLISLNGQPLAGAHSEKLRDHSVDFNFRVLRGNQLLKILVPAQTSVEFGYFPEAGLGVLGSANGLKVVRSPEGSSLRVGDLITAIQQQTIRTPKDLADRAKQTQGELAITVTSGNENKYFALRSENLRSMTGSQSINVESFGLLLENLFEFYSIQVKQDSRAEELGFETGDQLMRLNNKSLQQISGLVGEFDNFQSANVRRQNRGLQIDVNGVKEIGGNLGIQVANLTNKSVNLIWKQGRDQEVIYQTIQPNQIVFQNTWYGHNWLVRDGQTGQVLKEFSAATDGQGIVVTVPGSAKTWTRMGIVGKTLPNRNVLVGQVLEDSKAAKLGLLMGDQIVSINDVPAGGIADDQSIANTDFKVSVQFHGLGEPHDLSILNSGRIEPDPTIATDFPTPDWVTHSNPGVPGGITVTIPDPDHPPAIADLASFYVKDKSKEPLELVRVHHYGTQVVAGSKQYLVCEMRNRRSDERSFWNVEIYMDLDGRAELKSATRLK